MDSLRARCEDSVSTLRSTGVNDLTRLEDLISKIFPHGASLSTAEAAFVTEINGANGSIGPNATLVNAEGVVKDEIAKFVANIQCLEKFINLNTPAMEDGNNFGVSVQMIFAKYLKDVKDEALKKLDIVTAYYSSRADAVDKVNGRSSKSETTTSSESSSKGGKDGAEDKSGKTTVAEEKKSFATNDPNRIKAIAAIDVKFYFDLGLLMRFTTDSYAVVLDNLEKNYEKLKTPKGESGGNYSGMF